MNFTYKHIRSEILSDLEHVESAAISYPDYNVESFGLDVGLQNLKMSIQESSCYKVIRQILVREYLPWEIVLKIKSGRKIRTLTVTHMVYFYPDDVIDEFRLCGEQDGVKDPPIHLVVHGKGKVTIRDFDLTSVCDADKPKIVGGKYFEDLVVTEDARCVIYNVFMMYLWGVPEDIQERESAFEKTQNRYISAVEV